MAKRSTDRRKQRPATKRHFPRTARLNTLLHEIIADYIDRIDDDRLGFLTVTGVEVDADLNKAQVFLSSFADESEDDVTLETLQEYRKPLQGEIARSARLRKTPEVVFAFDPAVREGAKIENILSTLDIAPDPDDEPEQQADETSGADE